MATIPVLTQKIYFFVKNLVAIGEMNWYK